jgi:adenine-specific DNA methylase
MNRVALDTTFPATRYQGSKRKLAASIVEALRDVECETVLDAFGGTGAVAYAFKGAGKQVTYNDILAFNHQIGLALIENDDTRITDAEIEQIGQVRPGIAYGDFIERTFAGIYFTDEENRWLDLAVGNIRAIGDRLKRALAWYALFQAAMAKRPYNLFHRANLYMRTADVARSFGNKATWDKPFAEHFARFAHAGNRAVIDGRGSCRAICGDATNVSGEFDLVYIDPPYINARGVGVDYHSFYHFLEGMVRYDEWPDLIDERFKHRPLRAAPQPWTDPQQCHAAFRDLFERFRRACLVVSYRSDGVPTIDELCEMMKDVKAHLRVVWQRPRAYALSDNRASKEVILIGTS